MNHFYEDVASARVSEDIVLENVCSKTNTVCHREKKYLPDIAKHKNDQIDSLKSGFRYFILMFSPYSTSLKIASIEDFLLEL